MKLKANNWDFEITTEKQDWDIGLAKAVNNYMHEIDKKERYFNGQRKVWIVRNKHYDKVRKIVEEYTTRGKIEEGEQYAFDFDKWFDEAEERANEKARQELMGS